jgi:hypothetical protein
MSTKKLHYLKLLKTVLPDSEMIKKEVLAVSGGKNMVAPVS